MKKTFSQKRRIFSPGWTLMELTLAMALGMGVASAGVMLLNQNVSFMRVISQFSFLRDDAPTVNLLMGRLIQQADTYRIFPDRGSAVAGTGAVNTNGKAVWLRFRNPDGTFDQAIVSYETVSGVAGLHFFYHDRTGFGSTPAWTVSSKPANVTFANDTGVLLITVTGPNAEEITYSGVSL